MSALVDQPPPVVLAFEWLPAAWAGVCARCSKPYPAGTSIAYEGHALGWRASCCSAVSR